MMTTCRYSKCLHPFEGILAYCCLGHQLEAKKEGARKSHKKAGWYKEKKRENRNAVKGRYCKWPHCSVDDALHIKSWNSPVDVCPSCYRQGQRVGLCSACSGPLYKSVRRRKSIYCPTCDPLLPTNGEVSITLVCSVSGREKNVVRGIDWKLPDGTQLHKIAKYGFAVITFDPLTWARFRV